jgi:hypothetical protein
MKRPDSTASAPIAVSPDYVSLLQASELVERAYTRASRAPLVLA